MSVRNGTLLLDGSDESSIKYGNEWWGDAYYLPPNVRYGGLIATVAAGGICIGAAGLNVWFAIFGPGTVSLEESACGLVSSADRPRNERD